MRCKIILHGCDDSTYFEMDLSEKEYKLIQEVSKKSVDTSSYGCMPIMEVSKIE